MGRRRRLIVLVAVAVVLVGSLTVFRLRAEHQVNAVLNRARARAAGVRVSPSQIVASAFTPDSTIADSLGVHPDEISLHESSPPDWCLGVNVHRLGASGHSAFVVSSDGLLRESPGC